jgi:hypothetical protein
MGKRYTDESMASDGNMADTPLKLAYRLSLPVKLVQKMVENGLPVREDGAFDVDACKAWRDARLGDLEYKGEKFKVPSTVERFKAHRGDIYAIEQAESLRLQGVIRREKFTLAQIRELDTRKAMDLYDTLRKDQKDKFEQERLERGESTENVAVIVQAIREAKKKRREVKSIPHVEQGGQV